VVRKAQKSNYVLQLEAARYH